MHAYIYVCMYACMYCMRIYVSACICVYMHVCILCMHVCIHVCMYVIFKLDFERYRGNCPSWEGELSGGELSGAGIIWGREKCPFPVILVRDATCSSVKSTNSQKWLIFWPRVARLICVRWKTHGFSALLAYFLRYHMSQNCIHFLYVFCNIHWISFQHVLCFVFGPLAYVSIPGCQFCMEDFHNKITIICTEKICDAVVYIC